ncbi:hypothetical protein AGMMS49944_14200 [Spirochaetia bacterium]|nr:hypothetical protein AGMMS49944_14200 [Spirochaetia bacterium]
MKAVPTLILVVGMSLFTACQSNREKPMVRFGPIPEYREKTSLFELIDHENAPEDMPEWVSRYINAGINGIEGLPEYADSYVFIGMQRGSNQDSLKLWADSFSLDRDFPRLVSARVQARFSAFANGNPDEEFGRYFERVVKNTIDAAFEGVIQESSYWIKKRTFDDDGLNPTGEVYEYYILTRIPRDALENQINLLLITARTDLPPTRDQSAAAMRLRLNFFDGF